MCIKIPPIIHISKGDKLILPFWKKCELKYLVPSQNQGHNIMTTTRPFNYLQMIVFESMRLANKNDVVECVWLSQPKNI
jgi:hypothetical protein